MSIKSALKKLTIVIFVITVSIPTPIFSQVVGGMLSLVGSFYEKDFYGQNTKPVAYVILGGGLTQNQHGNTSLITLNNYSLLRTKTLWQHLKQEPLSVVTSGVESPWIIDSLQFFAKKDNITLNLNPQTKTNSPNSLDLTLIGEMASMNTCENAWFSTRLMNNAKDSGIIQDTSHVYLVSDWYHMARARRQFAKAGIQTTPLVAPMPTQTSWTNYTANLNHSRRAFYESVALVRDIVRPQKNCRDANTLSIDELTTPRRTLKTF